MSAGQNFWSRRRAQVQAEEARILAEEQAAAAARLEHATEAELADLPEEEVLARLDLPEPESVASGDMLQKFMSNGIPSHLRKRAMRALWRSDPIYANLDGLVDYADDYTDAATVVPNLKTAYQVGKGMLAHIEHLAAEQQAKDAKVEDADLVAEAITDEAAEEHLETAELSPAVSTDAAEIIQSENQPQPERPSKPARRMQFRVAGEEATV